MSRSRPAMVVPDPGVWAIRGVDLEDRGFHQAACPAEATVLVLPPTLPAGLIELATKTWEEIPPPRQWVEIEGPDLGGMPSSHAINGHGEGHDMSGGGHEGHDMSGHEGHNMGGSGHEGHDMSGGGGHDMAGMDHAGMDHGDMMAIVGDPSRDGLIMEPIELEHGPLAPGLPGGLTLAVSLDGDVVAKCEAGEPLAAPVDDPLAPFTSATLRSGAPLTPATIAGIERERALGHLLWLRGFGLVLGWRQMEDRAREAAAPLLDPVNPDTGTALASAGSLLDLLEDNRRLRYRTRGRGTVPTEDALSKGISGPNARASGVAEDSRQQSALYGQLGFRIRLQESGDAEARVLQRVGEALDSLRLVEAAGRFNGPAGDETTDRLEGPRGSLEVHDGQVHAAGTEAARRLAGELAVDLEWASALAVIASFDLSPWEVAR